ncbi:DUF2577 family protein [Acetanaerobacterium elongatum]|uniref:Uncharacterized protein n=1 Tax=Acetanaerobacterium elongatum TaxID=258515 RepID=A0A1G9Z2Q2_9FIRM|nr:DUF2577 family protein [Acetanaerobacterium elongatum]SDN15457.1 Protein of unknown function [Acetanaerobacterium elongatum]
MSNLHSAIKRVALNSMNNENLADVVYATYTGSGLKIDGKPVAVPVNMIDIPHHLTDYDVDMQEVQGGALVGERKTYRVFNALKKNERVSAVQKRGSQRYAIIDRL